MLVIPYAAQELTNRFVELEVPNPEDYEVGQSYEALAEDPDGRYPVLATIAMKDGNVIAGTFTDRP